MDNNFNQQPVQQMPQTQQPVYQQPVPQQMPQQMPQQQAYQQPMQPMQQMPQQTYQQPAPKKPSNINTKELLALILSGVGTLLAVIGSICTCSCSASNAYDSGTLMSSALGALGSLTGSSSSVSMDIHSTSLVCILAIVGALVAATGVVFGILAVKDKNATVKAGKMAYIAMAVGVFGFMYGILPVLTICGYNCSLNSNMTDSLGQSLK